MSLTQLVFGLVSLYALKKCGDYFRSHVGLRSNSNGFAGFVVNSNIVQGDSVGYAMSNNSRCIGGGYIETIIRHYTLDQSKCSNISIKNMNGTITFVPNVDMSSNYENENEKERPLARLTIVLQKPSENDPDFLLCEYFEDSLTSKEVSVRFEVSNPVNVLDTKGYKSDILIEISKDYVFVKDDLMMDVSLITMNGDIGFDGCGLPIVKKLFCKTMNGTVSTKIEKCKELQCETMNGRIICDYISESIPQKTKLNTMNGGILVSFEDGVRSNLHFILDTMNGRVRSDVQHSILEKKKNYLRGVCNDANASSHHVLYANSMNGSISLK